MQLFFSLKHFLLFRHEFSSLVGKCSFGLKKFQNRIAFYYLGNILITFFEDHQFHLYFACGVHVVTANIVDANVTTAKLADDAVTAAKITDNAVGAAA